MRIVSWNVNGLRSVTKKEFQQWLANSEASIVGIQESKISLEKVPKELNPPHGWNSYYSEAEQKGYSGTALFLKQRPLDYQTSIDVPLFDREGRVQYIDCGAFVVFNVYFPNGKGSAKDNSRVPYKMAFYQRLLEKIQQIRMEGKEVVVMGDFNTAHREIDLKNWKANQKISGFLPEERQVLDQWMDYGFVDTYRHIHGNQEAYTWWSPLSFARQRNVGWRIDYVWITKGLIPALKDAFIWADVMGSDHCPVGIDIET